MFSKFLEAIQHYFRALKLLQDEKNFVALPEADVHRNYAEKSKGHVAEVFTAFVEAQLRVQGFEELLGLWRRMLSVSQGILEACTSENGEIGTLNEAEKIFWLKASACTSENGETGTLNEAEKNFWLKASAKLEELIEKGSQHPQDLFEMIPPGAEMLVNQEALQAIS